MMSYVASIHVSAEGVATCQSLGSKYRTPRFNLYRHVHGDMQPRPLFISLIRMHHISNPSKFRRLKRFAVQAKVSGLAKTGKPGVAIFDGDKESIKAFLENARGLRYVDFHHVTTKLVVNGIEKRVADGQIGLQEVQDMNKLVNLLDGIGEKEWFRTEMGMSRG
ncbi:unnamed protein product [Cyclocybe aegerita]|uniref:Uncharacterized protein n=1 Tax=Cyclocybe aegerita TaxID=1973307 RepID=A0A8S0VSG2_CYCAE|nr:unnamed protein product [Cyclocybe aegerita]